MRRHKVTAFHISFHACAGYANENLLALYKHVHAVHVLPSFHVPTHVLKKVGEGKRHTRRRERERVCFAWMFVVGLFFLFWFITWIQLLN